MFWMVVTESWKFIFKTLMAACSILFCKMFGNRFVQLTVFSQPYPADKIGNKTRVQQRRDAFKKNDVRTLLLSSNHDCLQLFKCL